MRVPIDFYPTPDWAICITEPILSALPPPGLILEPSAGDGRVVKFLAERFPDAGVYGIEIDPERANAAGVVLGDFLAVEIPPMYDLVMTNPPFASAMPFVQKALASIRSAGHVLMLLRLGFLESAKRSGWLSEHMPDVFVLDSRPSWHGGGSDKAAYAWFLWGKAPRSEGRISILRKRSSDKRSSDK